MEGAFASFIANYRHKRDKIPTHLFTDLHRLEYYQKMESRGVYSIEQTYDWPARVGVEPLYK